MSFWEPYTLRELVWRAEKKECAEWDRAALIAASVRNLFGGECDPKTLNPLRR